MMLSSMSERMAKSEGQLMLPNYGNILQVLQLYLQHFVDAVGNIPPCCLLMAGVSLLEVAVDQLSPETYDVDGVVAALQKEQPKFLGPDVVSINQVRVRDVSAKLTSESM